MKVIELTPTTSETLKIKLVIGPGIFFCWGETNKATMIETIKGTILVKETPEQITALINENKS